MSIVFLTVFAVVNIFFVTCYRTSLKYEYRDHSGKDILEYTSFYDTEWKRPYQVIIIYSCDMARFAENHTSPSRPNFKPDPRLPEKDQAVDDDYRGSGLSRGHLTTASYFSFDKDAYYNTFFLTNVAPQYQKANQLWYNKDEKVILEWAAKNSNCKKYVVLDIATIGDSGTIGEGEVVIPEYFVNAVCEPETGNSICFYGDNLEDADHVWYGSVESCESLFKFEFFIDNILKNFHNCRLHKDHVDEEFWGVNHKKFSFLKKKS